MALRRRPRRLSEEERLLWSTVARTVRPLPGRPTPDEPVAPQPKEMSGPLSAPQPEIPYGSPRRSGPRVPDAEIDRPTRRKLARGRIGIDARIDLHDRTQAEAHPRLLSFVQAARAAGLRHILVITGKGSGEGGILRRSVPSWLKTRPFAEHVSGFDTAARQHGGEGAIYVRLRRRKEAP